MSSPTNFGVAFITCNRESFLRQSMASFADDIGQHPVVIVNDGDPLTQSAQYGTLVENGQNKGVGVSKNIGMQWLLQQGCHHIFVIEDDIVKHPDAPGNVFERYLEVAKVSGLQHLMFGYHGPANKQEMKSGAAPRARVVIGYDPEERITVALNANCVGAFCYYSRPLLEDIGLMDERYFNAFEHVDHSYMACKRGYLPGYWWWPDVGDSAMYLDEIACSEHNSSIRPRSDWRTNVENGVRIFTEKHGVAPYGISGVKSEHEQVIFDNLKQIKLKYGS